MYLTEMKKPNDCDGDCECKDCEMRFANDDKNILVSVSPRCFQLPKGTNKRAKMKIRNKNSYPIYFTANTSNMDVFRPLPNKGRIPPNGKATIDVEFSDSAMPLRRHEEVLVFTSVKPLEQLESCKEKVCPNCMEFFDFSKHRVQKSHYHENGYQTDPDHRSYRKKDKLTRYVAKGYEKNVGSDSDDFEMQYETPKRKLKIEYESKCREKNKREILQEKKKIAQKITDYSQVHPKVSHLDEKAYRNRDYRLGETEHRNVTDELQELCIHAPVHSPSEGGCKCRYCVELWTDKQESYSTSEKQNYARRMKNIKDTTEDRMYRTGKGTYSVHQTKSAENERKGRGIDAHILTRILIADGGKELFTDADLSELRDKGVLSKYAKIISEEDYKTEDEKFKKKFLKRYAEEYECTTAEDKKDQQKESDEKSEKMERKLTLKDLDEKCNSLLNLSYVNIFLKVPLVLILVGVCIYCCRFERTDERADNLSCLFDILLHYFG